MLKGYDIFREKYTNYERSTCIFLTLSFIIENKKFTKHIITNNDNHL